jgi:hypothetical protein
VVGSSSSQLKRKRSDSIKNASCFNDFMCIMFYIYALN